MCYTNRLVVVALLGLLGMKTHAQESPTGFWQPSLAINYKVSGTYSHNFSIAKRSFILRDKEVLLAVRQLDLVHFSAWQLQDNQSVALGLQYRFRQTFDGGANELRLTQQYNLRFKPYVVRYGHRFRSEQRITQMNTVHRFRYRFSTDFPLKGEKLDNGEPYFVGNSEGLLSISAAKPQYDVRLTFFLGWKLGDRTKFQVGTEYRIEDFAQNASPIFFLLGNLNVTL